MWLNDVRESHIYVLSQYAETLSKSDMLDPEPMLSMTIIRKINCNGVMLISTLNNKKFRD